MTCNTPNRIQAEVQQDLCGGPRGRPRAGQRLYQNRERDAQAAWIEEKEQRLALGRVDYLVEATDHLAAASFGSNTTCNILIHHLLQDGTGVPVSFIEEEAVADPMELWFSAI